MKLSALPVKTGPVASIRDSQLAIRNLEVPTIDTMMAAGRATSVAGGIRTSKQVEGNYQGTDYFSLS